MTTEIEIDKLPPRAIEIEQAVLGAAILEKEGLTLVMQNIRTVDIFYDTRNANIFSLMQQCYENGESIDILTIVNAARRAGIMEKIGGPQYVAGLTERVNSASNMESHIKILYEKHIKRKTIQFGYYLQGKGYDETTDVFETLDKLQLGLDKLRSGFLRNQIQTIHEVIPEVVEDLNRAMCGKKGIMSPIGKLNQYTGGWGDSDLIIIAARPGMGKTAMLTEQMRKLAANGTPAGIFSLEMSAGQLVARIAVAEHEVRNQSGITNQDFRQGNLSTTDFQKICRTMDKFHNLPIVIDDTAGISTTELRSKAIEMKAKHKVKIILVDYLQLIRSPSRQNRNDEVGEVARSLKNLAKELCLPVIALCQLSRAVEGRTDKTPQLSDLRESGEIEQAADLIGFLYRPEYYNIESLSDGSSTKNYAEFVIAKHRSGDLARVPYLYRKEFNIVADWDEMGLQSVPHMSNINIRNYGEPDAIVQAFDSETPGF